MDRWLAVLAAYHLSKNDRSSKDTAAACVIDAGTAVTVDGVDGKGLHLGGLIVPGIQMMIDALLDRTGDIARQARKLSGASNIDASGRVKSARDGTAKAVANGALLAVASASDRSVAEIKRQVSTDVKVFLTGGDADRIKPAMQTPAQIVPDLVLQGLALLASS